ncbi:MAG: Crp/Fnr family transcriptional regulator [Saprospirales bacterium]|nr:MAG: Crp/Fnr family transcriptional regulator [Saprospirales bacterium]
MVFKQQLKDMKEDLIKYFPRLDDKRLLEEIMQVGRHMHISRGEILINYGTYINQIPLLLEGSIKVSRQFEDGRELYLYHLYPGESCAVSVSCCMSLAPSPFFAIAEDDSELIGIPVEYMELWQKKYLKWNQFILSTYEERFRELILTLDDVAFKKLDQRLMAFLRKKSEAINNLSINITHQQIAEELNTARESVSRLLKTMESRGIIELRRNTIVLKKLEI